MPKSRVRRRKSAAYTPPATTGPRKRKHSPAWFGWVVGAFLLFGTAWLVTSYVTGTDMPVMRTLGQWNIAIGFAFIAVGFALATQWH